MIYVEKFPDKGFDDHVFLMGAMKSMAEKYMREGKGNIKIVEYTVDADTMMYTDALDLKGDVKEKADILVFDVNYSTSAWPYRMISTKKLADLTPFLDADSGFKKEDFVGKLFDAGTVGSQTFLMPVFFGSSLVIGNDKKSAELGLPTSADAADYDTFWDKIAKAELSIPLFAEDSGENTPAIPRDMYQIFSCGKNLWDFAAEEVNFDDADFKKAVTAFLKHSPADIQLLSGNTNGVNRGGTVSAARVLQGKAGLVMVNTGNPESTLNTAVTNRLTDCYVSYLPNVAGGEGHGAFVTTSMGIGADSPRKGAAYRFMMYCLQNDEFYTMQTRYGFSYAAKASVLRDSCAKAVTGVSETYGAEKLLEMGYSADDLYQEITNLNYACLADHGIRESFLSPFKSAILNGGTADDVAAAMNVYWKGILEKK